MATTDPLLGKILRRNFQVKKGFIQSVRVIELLPGYESDEPEERRYKVQITRNDGNVSKIGRTRTATGASLVRDYTLVGG